MLNWGGELYEGKHEPIVSKDLFQRANSFPGRPRINNFVRKYLLTGLVKDENGKTLKGYTAKGKWIYYKNEEKSSVSLNISEKKVFEQSVELFNTPEYNFPE